MNNQKQKEIIVKKGTWNENTEFQYRLSRALPDGVVSTAVSACVYYGDSIVMIKNRRGYEIVCGHVEERETIEQALAREILEETGCEIESSEMFAYTYVHNTVKQFSKSTGLEYPEFSYIPCFFVIAKNPPQETDADDIHEFQLCLITDEIIQNSTDRDLVLMSSVVRYCKG